MPQYRVLDTLKHEGKKYKNGALLELTLAQAKAMNGLVERVETEGVERSAISSAGDEAKKKTSKGKSPAPLMG